MIRVGVQLGVAMALSFSVAGAGSAAHAQGMTLSVRSHQPSIPYSGRINAIAIDPRDTRRVLVTSESGGLFASTDGGDSWRHVDEVPFLLNDVEILAGDPRVILVTAAADFENRSITGSVRAETISGGGTWISRDDGATWAQSVTAAPRANKFFSAILRCPPRYSAYGIDVDQETGRIFVATECGVSYSDDRGLNWTHEEINYRRASARNRSFYAVAALHGNGVVLAGLSGVWYSADNGDSWAQETGGLGQVVVDLHAAAGVSGRARLGYVVTLGPASARQLWKTDNGGRTWSRVAGAPVGGGGCGGIAHVKAFPESGSLSSVPDRVILFFGNACATQLRMGSGWTALAANHGDTRDLAVWPRTPGERDWVPVPAFLASDGGLDRSSDGSTFTLVGAGPGKLNALQIYQVIGQAPRIGDYHLAIGTQDNNLWASADSGRTWPEAQSTRSEGGGIRLARRVHDARHGKWTYFTCGDCFNQMSDPLFRNQVGWPAYETRPGWGTGQPQPLNGGLDGRYVYISFPLDGTPVRDGDPIGIEHTDDYGRSSRRILSVPEPIRGQPEVTGAVATLGVVTGRYDETVFDGAQSYLDSDLLRFWDMERSGRAAQSTYPAMNGFGSIGHYAYQFAWAPVYAVNPRDPDHIIAPDVQNREVKVTRDGGETWSTIGGLAGLVTENGRYQFALPSPVGGYSFSLVSTVSFFPDNPRLIGLGLQQGGVYVSSNSGSSWAKVPGTEKLNNITDLHWENANEIYVSSFGSGLWKISTGLDVLMEPLERLCVDIEQNVSGFGFFGVAFDLNCNYTYTDRAAWSSPDLFRIIDFRILPEHVLPMREAMAANRFDQVVFAVNGRIMEINAKAESSEDQIITTPGTSLISYSRHSKKVEPKAQPPGSVQRPKFLIRRPLESPDEKMQDVLKQPRRQGPAEKEQMQQQAPPANQDQDGAQDGRPVAVAVTYANGKITGVVTDDSEVTFDVPDAPTTYQPPAKPRKRKPSGPEISLLVRSPVFLGHPVASQSDELTVRARGFLPRLPVAVEVDGRPVKVRVKVLKDGSFTLTLPLLELMIGHHQVAVIQNGPNRTQRVSQTFTIRHSDKGASERPQ